MPDIAKITALKHISLTIEHNPHASDYQNLADYITERGPWYEDDSFCSPTAKQDCLDTNSLWTVQWYPRTPIGFYVVHGPTLEACLESIPDKLWAR